MITTKHQIFGIISILIFITIGTQCKSNKKQQEECEKYTEGVGRCMFEFQMNGENYYLDSTLAYIEKASKVCGDNYDQSLMMSTLQVYAYQNKYSDAVTLISSKGDAYGLPYYKNLLLNRFKAMEAQTLGDTVKKNEYLNNIIQDVENYMKENKDSILSIYQQPKIENIIQSEYSIIPIQFFYYKSQLKGIENTNVEIDSLQIGVNGNQEYFEMIKGFLRNEFMYFIGI